MIDANGPITFEDLNQKSGLSHDLLKSELKNLKTQNLIVDLTNSDIDYLYYLSASDWNSICAKIQDLLGNFHKHLIR